MIQAFPDSIFSPQSKQDFDEVLRYAEFRKARRALEAGKRNRAKR
jgi:hypothetical protein